MRFPCLPKSGAHRPIGWITQQLRDIRAAREDSPATKWIQRHGDIMAHPRLADLHEYIRTWDKQLNGRNESVERMRSQRKVA